MSTANNRFSLFSFGLILYVATACAYSESLEAGYFFSIYATNINPTNIAIGALFILLIIQQIRINDDSSANLMYTFFVIMVFIPIISISSITRNLYPALLACSISAAILLPISSGKEKLKTKSKTSIDTAAFITVSSLILIALISYKYKDIMRISSFSEVYELRLQAREITNYFYGLLISWARFVFAPTCLVLAIYYKNKRMLIVAISLYAVTYMSTGSKSDVIYPVAIAGAMYLINRFKTLDLPALIFFAISISAISIYVLDHFSITRAYPFTIERVLVAPGVLFNAYYEFFSEREKAYLGYSIFSNIIDYRYLNQPAFIIGAENFSENARANASFLVDGYANFGLLGIAIYSGICRLLISLYDSASSNWPKSLRILIIIPFIIFLTNASPLTMIVTGGFFWAIIIGIFFRVKG